nr:DUF4835 family protein [Bacteroidota bacterium]
MKKRILSITFILISFIIGVNAQELNCRVQVNSAKIPGSDKSVFTNMQQVMTDFMNNTRWTNDKYRSEEKIECSMNIIIDSRPSTDQYKASIQITSNRPVYKTTYSSPMVNIKDDYFEFRFVEFQQLEYNENAQNSNLVSVLAYYANIILGFDYDSFSMMGGSTYFTKAQTIVNNSANVPEPGWRAFENDRNRYWLVENLNSNAFKPVRELTYNLHRKGLDEMSKDQQEALRLMAENIEKLKAVNKAKPISWLLQVFCYAKSEEIINIFKGEPVPPNLKVIVKSTMQEIDAVNAGNYDGIK